MIINGFHDENVVGIALDSSAIHISVNDGKKNKPIIINGLKRLKVDNFKEGNVISKIHCHTGKKCEKDKENIKKALLYLYEIDDSLISENKLNKFIEKQLDDIFLGELVLFEVEPSYGCYIAALGESITSEGINLTSK